MAQMENDVYLTKQEYEWILESLHDFNLQHHEYDHRIYKMMNKLREQVEKFQFCHECLTPWVQRWSSDTHECPLVVKIVEEE